MPSGQRGPLKPQLLFHAPSSQYLNVLQLAGEGDGVGGSTGSLTARDAISGYSSGIGDASNWFLDTGIYLDDGHYLDTGIFAAATLLEGAALGGSSGGIGSSVWLLDSGVLLDDGTHYFDTAASPVLELAALAGEGDGVGGGSGILTGPPEVLPEGGPYYRPVRVHKPQPPPKRIPVHIQAEPTVVEVEIPRQPEVGVAANNRAVIAAFYAAGAIDEEEFTALIAA